MSAKVSGLVSFALRALPLNNLSIARQNTADLPTIATVRNSSQLFATSTPSNANGVVTSRQGKQPVSNALWFQGGSSPDARALSTHAPACGPEGEASQGGCSGSDRESRRGVRSLRTRRNPGLTASRVGHLFGPVPRQLGVTGSKAGRQRCNSAGAATIFAALALTFLPVSASADMLSSFVFHAPIQGADTWSTSIARARGGAETNPLMGDGNVGRMLLVKAPLTLGLSWLDHQIGKKSKRNQWIYRGVFIVGYGLIVHKNLNSKREVR